jgi:hypothetical protein
MIPESDHIASAATVIVEGGIPDPNLLPRCRIPTPTAETQALPDGRLALELGHGLAARVAIALTNCR